MLIVPLPKDEPILLLTCTTSQQTAVQDGLHRCHKTLHTVFLKMLKSPNRTKSVLITYAVIHLIGVIQTCKLVHMQFMYM